MRNIINTLKIKLPKIFILTALITLFLSIFIVPACADVSDEQAINIISTYPLEQNTPIMYLLRLLGWLIILGLAWLIDGVSNAIFTISSTLGGFFSSDEATALLEKIKPMAMIGFLIVVGIIGLQFIIRAQIKPEIIQNLIIGLIVIVGLPIMIVQAFSLTTAAIEVIGGENQSFSNQILKDNVTDNLLYEQTNFESSELNPKNNIAKDDFSKINPVEMIKHEESKAPKVWENEIKTDPNGTKSLQKLGIVKLPIAGEIDIMGGRYYRYGINLFTVLLTELITLLALVFTAIKIARLLFEVVVHQALANVFALIDVQNGQRLKKCLTSIMGTFGTLIACVFMFQLYIIGCNYITVHLLNNGNWFAYILAMIGLAWALIDGPNILEQLLGVDAGLHSAGRTVMAAYAGTRMAGGAMKGGKNMLVGKSANAPGGKKGIGGAVGGAAKAVKGVGKGATSVAKGLAAPGFAAAGKSAGVKGKENEFGNKGKNSVSPGAMPGMAKSGATNSASQTPASSDTGTAPGASPTNNMEENQPNDLPAMQHPILDAAKSALGKTPPAWIGKEVAKGARGAYSAGHAVGSARKNNKEIRKEKRQRKRYKID